MGGSFESLVFSFEPSKLGIYYLVFGIAAFFVAIQLGISDLSFRI
jgi:hypothetical protein